MGSEKSKHLNALVETEVVAPAPRVVKSVHEKVEKSSPRQKSYCMDLRIFSPSSLGYIGVDGIDTAPALVRLAKVKGLDVIGITDFYSGHFIDRMVEAAKNSNVTVIPSVDINCTLGGCRDVHLSCLFPETFLSNSVEKFLNDLKIPTRARGDRRYIVSRPLGEILEIVEAVGGVAMPSRMDKTPQRQAVIPVLVDEFGFRAFDLAYADSTKFFKTRWPKLKFQLFSFSHANALAQIGSRTARVKLNNAGFEGIRELVGREARA